MSACSIVQTTLINGNNIIDETKYSDTDKSNKSNDISLQNN